MCHESIYVSREPSIQAWTDELIDMEWCSHDRSSAKGASHLSTPTTTFESKLCVCMGMGECRQGC
jgi:hypothetical protein